MTLFLIIFIALGDNIQPSLGTPPSQAIIDQSLELIEKCKVIMAEGGDCSKHFNKKMEAMLLDRCKLAKSEPIMDDAAKLEINRNCKALQNGGEQLLNDKSLVEKDRFFQTNGQKMVEILKKTEKEELSIEGLNGSLAVILSNPEKHPESKLVQFFVSLRELLRLEEQKMSAGQPKQILNDVLAQNPIMPSNVMELMMQLWPHYRPEVRQGVAQSRRKRRNNERAVNVGVFVLVLVVAYLMVSFLQGAFSMVNGLLEYGFVSFALSCFIFAFIRQQRFYHRVAASLENQLNKQGIQTRY